MKEYLIYFMIILPIIGVFLLLDYLSGFSSDNFLFQTFVTVMVGYAVVAALKKED